MTADASTASGDGRFTRLEQNSASRDQTKSTFAIHQAANVYSIAPHARDSTTGLESADTALTIERRRCDCQ
jgi:hypothetical protein